MTKRAQNHADQLSWLEGPSLPAPPPESPLPRGQLLKWIGSKHRFATAIVQRFPGDIQTYFEPFVGSASVLAALTPARAVASDVLLPLVEFWRAVQNDPDLVERWYADRWQEVLGDPHAVDRVSQAVKAEGYMRVRARFNASPNAADLLFLLRACYGGVVRFSKSGTMNTPCGIHRPIPPDEFARRLRQWRPRIAGCRFEHADFETMIDSADRGDLVYCDPPYSDCESTLYGAQGFQLSRLLAAIERAKARGVRVALSIDGTKRSGSHTILLDLPSGVFETEALVDVGRSMLRRFQLGGQTLESEVVADRLLLTWATE